MDRHQRCDGVRSLDGWRLNSRMALRGDVFVHFAEVINFTAMRLRGIWAEALPCVNELHISVGSKLELTSFT